MVDRFGKIPIEVHELLRSFELRWKATEMGIERIIFKSEKVIAHFISDPNASFYQTDAFQSILQNVMNATNGVRMAQKNEKLRLILEPIRNISECYQRLESLQ
jgi:transcription-repair coupling factor (superfamily II helicase)